MVGLGFKALKSPGATELLQQPAILLQAATVALSGQAAAGTCHILEGNTTAHVIALAEVVGRLMCQ